MPEIRLRPYEDPRDSEHNFLSLKDHVEDKDYKLWFPARVFGNPSGTALEGTYAAGWYWGLVDAIDSDITADTYIPTYWTNGKLGVTVYYTGSTSSTNPFRVVTTVDIYSLNGNALTTTGEVSSSDTSLPAGPATANELLTFSTAEANWPTVKATYNYVSVNIERTGGNASDTNTGDLNILGAVLRYYPTRR